MLIRLVPLFLCMATLLVFSDDSIAKKKRKMKAPDWVGENCTKKEGFYYFVGFGEGSNASIAARNALIDSRRNALVCLFGGTITSSMTIAEDNKSSTFESLTSLELNYSDVNWASYEKIPDRSFFHDEKQTKVYMQYRWKELVITQEKDRLEKLSSEIQKTKTQKKEISIQRRLIDQQKAQLQELQIQEEEMKGIKNAAEKAALRLREMKRVKEAKSRDIAQLIPLLYCGITIGDFIEVYQKPDSIEGVATGIGIGSSLVNHIAFNWHEYQVQVRYEYLKSIYGSWPTLRATRKYSYDKFMKLKNYPIKFVYSDYGLTQKGWSTCD